MTNNRENEIKEKINKNNKRIKETTADLVAENNILKDELYNIEKEKSEKLKKELEVGRGVEIVEWGGIWYRAICPFCGEGNTCNGDTDEIYKCDECGKDFIVHDFK